MNNFRKKGGKKRMLKKRKDFFNKYKIDYIDYKNKDLLLRFLNVHYRIITRKITGTTAKNQSKLATAIKRARYMALIPYMRGHALEARPERSSRPEGRPDRGNRSNNSAK